MNHATAKSFILSLFFVAAFPLSLLAQDITGIWRGYFHNDVGDEYRFELQVEQTGTNRISGVSYSYLDVRFYGKATLTGNFNKKTKAALIQEIKTVEVKMSSGSTACIMKCSFVYSRSGNEEFLDGTYSSTFEKTNDREGVVKGGGCGDGTVHLRRVTTSDFYVEPFLRKKLDKTTAKTPAKTNVPKTGPAPKAGNTSPKTTTPKATGPAPKSATKPVTKPPVSKPKTPAPATKTVKPGADTLSKPKPPVVIERPREIPKIQVPAVTRARENQLVKTFTVNEEEITVKFYDNGEIDNDTISVYLDGAPVITNQRLSTTAITVKLKVNTDNPEHTLVMVAENLGRIPPNTALMIVQDGDNRYQASITSTEQKNAMVRFRYSQK